MRKRSLYSFPITGKESASNAGDPSMITRSRRSPGEVNGNPLQYSYLENLMNRGSWWATVHEVTKSRIWLRGHHFHHWPQEDWTDVQSICSFIPRAGPYIHIFTALVNKPYCIIQNIKVLLTNVFIRSLLCVYYPRGLSLVYATIWEFVHYTATIT